MILVAGATGFLGREICRRLTAAGHGVRALVRPTSDPDAVRQLTGWGVDLVTGDLRDRDSLVRACEGIRAVVSTATTARSRQEGDSIEASDRQGQLNLVEAAGDAGTAKFVLVSVADRIATANPLTSAKRAVEDALRRSGMSYTLLRPGFFMEVWLSPALGFDAATGRAALYGDGTRPISWISLGDVAEYAVRSLDDPAAANATLELGGPDALSPLEVVRIFEEATGRTFEVQRVPVAELRAQAAAATDSLQQTFAALMISYAEGCEIPVNQDVRLGGPLRTVREHARSLAAELPPPSAT